MRKRRGRGELESSSALNGNTSPLQQTFNPYLIFLSIQSPDPAFLSKGLLYNNILRTPPNLTAMMSDRFAPNNRA